MDESLTDAWHTFLRSWCGDRLDGYDDADLAGAPLPPQLRRYYEVAGRTPTAFLHLVPPRNLTLTAGKVVFAVEEQGVYSIATLPEGDDPLVWLAEDGPWEPVGVRLGGFLRQYALFDLGFCCAAVGGWGYVSRDQLPALLAFLPELPLAPWRLPAPRTSFHAAVDLIGVVMSGGGDDLVEVHAAARSRAGLEPLLELVRWDDDPLG